MSREAMQIALDALEANLGNWAAKTKAVEVLRQALKTEQEPVAWMTHTDDLIPLFHKTRASALNWQTQPTPLYTAPPKQWVGLTDEEIHDLIYLSQKIDASNSPWFDCLGFYRAIEAKLKERNI